MKSIKEAFGDEVEILDFFSSKLPQLIEKYGEINSFFEIDPIFSVYIKDLDQRYSYCLHRSNDCEIEAREMIDFPLVSLEITSQFWPQLRGFLAQWVPKFVQSLNGFKGQFYLSKEIAAQLEKIDGQFQITLVLEGGTKVSGTLILNDYEVGKGIPKCSLTLQAGDLLNLLHQQGQDLSLFLGSVGLQGDLSFTAKVGHILSKGR